MRKMNTKTIELLADLVDKLAQDTGQPTPEELKAASTLVSIAKSRAPKKKKGETPERRLMHILKQHKKVSDHVLISMVAGGWDLFTQDGIKLWSHFATTEKVIGTWYSTKHIMDQLKSGATITETRWEPIVSPPKAIEWPTVNDGELLVTRLYALRVGAKAAFECIDKREDRGMNGLCIAHKELCGADGNILCIAPLSGEGGFDMRETSQILTPVASSFIRYWGPKADEEIMIQRTDTSILIAAEHTTVELPCAVGDFPEFSQILRDTAYPDSSFETITKKEAKKIIALGSEGDALYPAVRFPAGYVGTRKLQKKHLQRLLKGAPGNIAISGGVKKENNLDPLRIHSEGIHWLLMPMMESEK